MLSLRAEIAVCLFAVSLLGLFVGWMMQRARGRYRLRRTVAALEESRTAAEDSARRDVENLEDRLQSLGDEVRALKAENRKLRESSHEGGDADDSARAESIEVNRRHVETQERLQRIIREREREIATLRAGLTGRDPATDAVGLAAAPVRDANGALDDSPPAGGRPTEIAAIVAAEGLDETVRIDPSLLPAQLSVHAGDAPRADVHPIHAAVVAAPSDDDTGPLDDTLESTMDVAFLDAEEATVALDEETLALVRGLGRGERKG